MRFKPYVHGECEGSWRYSENEPFNAMTKRGTVSRRVVICSWCERQVNVSRRGTMHRHERRAP